jgi:hypothetical protein
LVASSGFLFDSATLTLTTLVFPAGLVFPDGATVATHARGINDLGQVVGLADVSPTPLPAALPLFATGLGGLGLLGCRKKQKPRAVAV